MDASTEGALRILDKIRREPIPAGPVALSEAYLRAVERLESRPEYRSGVDKTWVEAARRRFRQHFRQARLVR